MTVVNFLFLSFSFIPFLLSYAQFFSSLPFWTFIVFLFVFHVLKLYPYLVTCFLILVFIFHFVYWSLLNILIILFRRNWYQLWTCTLENIFKYNAKIDEDWPRFDKVWDTAFLKTIHLRVNKCKIKYSWIKFNSS